MYKNISNCYISFVDLVPNEVGIWKRVSELRDTKLKELASQLPTVLLGSHAETTNRTYNYMF